MTCAASGRSCRSRSRPRPSSARRRCCRPSCGRHWRWRCSRTCWRRSAAAPGLAGIVVVTLDPAATRAGRAATARASSTDGARDGHTGAVAAAARLLAAEGRGGMLTVPGDIPLVTADRDRRVIAAHTAGRRPSRSCRRTTRRLERDPVSPPDAVPLRFGDDSFFPHLAAAEACGIEPTVLRLPGIALDIDNPDDLAPFCAACDRRRDAGRLLAGHRMRLGMPRATRGIGFESTYFTEILARTRNAASALLGRRGAGARRRRRPRLPMMQVAAALRDAATAGSSPIRARSSSR